MDRSPPITIHSIHLNPGNLEEDLDHLVVVLGRGYVEGCGARPGIDNAATKG